MKKQLKQIAYAFILLIGFSQGAHSAEGDARERLDNFFTKVTTMQANFVQEIRDEKGKFRQKSMGKMYLQRPGRFRWEYTKPDKHLIVSDGGSVWIYDEDLDQVTVKSIKQTLASAPVGLLLSKQPVNQQFQVTPMKSTGRLDWFHLIPHKKDSDFTSMDIAIDQKGIQEMVLQDKFGQETLIHMNTVKIDPKINAKKFRFTPPAGADIIKG
jgi:outer membrane lipoprotein carrier protein